MSNKSILTIGVAVLVVLAGAWLLYAYYGRILQTINPSMQQESPYDDTRTIEQEYGQIPSDGELDMELNALDMELQGF